jgi:hypothetical protein
MSKDSPEGKPEFERFVRQNRRNILAQLFVMALVVFAIVTYISGSNERDKGVGSVAASEYSGGLPPLAGYTWNGNG